jgi:PD-(D/E)XK nuclease superfamily
MLWLHHSSIRLEELKANYRAVTGGANPSDEELSGVLDIFELGLAMMTNYQEHHGSPVPKRMRFCSPEQEVVVPIPGTEYACPDCMNGVGTGRSFVCTGCNGTGLAQHYLRGTLDGLLQDNQDRLYVLEHKTFGRRPNADVLDTQDQFLAYLWIIRELGIGKVAGVAYDGLWKRAKPPRGSSMEDLFIRTILHRSQAEMDEFGENLAKEANEMAGNPPIYTNRVWQGCYDCSYEKLCRAMSRGEDVGLIERTQFVERSRDTSLGVYVGAEEESEPY